MMPHSTMDHKAYDKRNYPIVDVRSGYGEWVRTYEQTVMDEMDLRLLGGLESVDWPAHRAILDLACGTGRIGEWMRSRCAPSATIDGIDLTPEMLEVARCRKVYRALYLADVTNSGLPSGAYDLIIQSLAEEHLPDLVPLYREASRVSRDEAMFVLVGYHPYFLLAGIPTHFDRESGESVTIRSYVHLMSDHVKAASACGWTLLEMHESLVDDALLQKKPKWEKYAGLPISFVMVWRRKDEKR